jgi:hypothetical protein
VARVWMPGVCLRPGLTAASRVRMIHLAQVLRLGCGAGMGASWRVMRGRWAADWHAAVRHRPERAAHGAAGHDYLLSVYYERTVPV